MAGGEWAGMVPSKVFDGIINVTGGGTVDGPTFTFPANSVIGPPLVMPPTPAGGNSAEINWAFQSDSIASILSVYLVFNDAGQAFVRTVNSGGPAQAVRVVVFAMTDP